MIFADALTLPFEQIINYDAVCIKIDEQVVNRAKDMLLLAAKHHHEVNRSKPI